MLNNVAGDVGLGGGKEFELRREDMSQGWTRSGNWFVNAWNGARVNVPQQLLRKMRRVVDAHDNGGAGGGGGCGRGELLSL